MGRSREGRKWGNRFSQEDLAIIAQIKSGPKGTTRTTKRATLDEDPSGTKMRNSFVGRVGSTRHTSSNAYEA